MTNGVAPRFDVVAACGSLSPRGDDSQDRGARLRLEPDAAALVVCDGVGSLRDSGAVAEHVVASVTRDAEAEGAALQLAKVLERADAEVREALPGIEGATTAITVLARPDGSVEWVLLGNGCVVEIAVIGEGDKANRILWGSHAVPEMGVRNGRYALTSVIPSSDAAPSRPLSGAVALPAGVTRLFLACSDGIMSEEETRSATAGDGVVWKDVPAPVVRLLTEAGRRWSSLRTLPLAALATELDDLVATALAASEANSELSDDATVGALLVRPCIPGDAS